MASKGAIAVVVSGTNGDSTAVSGEGDADSGEITSGFSIDVSAELFPIAVGIALIDAHMAGKDGIIIFPVISMGANGYGAG